MCSDQFSLLGDEKRFVLYQNTISQSLRSPSPRYNEFGIYLHPRLTPPVSAVRLNKLHPSFKCISSHNPTNHDTSRRTGRSMSFRQKRERIGSNIFNGSSRIWGSGG
jgi:hypothetical protein